MGKLVSTAGEMGVVISGVNREKNNIVMVGKLGAWDSGDTKEGPTWMGIEHVDMDFQMYFSPQDVRNLLGLMLKKPSLIFSTLLSSMTSFGKSKDRKQ